MNPPYFMVEFKDWAFYLMKQEKSRVCMAAETQEEMVHGRLMENRERKKKRPPGDFGGRFFRCLGLRYSLFSACHFPVFVEICRMDIKFSCPPHQTLPYF